MLYHASISLYKRPVSRCEVYYSLTRLTAAFPIAALLTLWLAKHTERGQREIVVKNLQCPEIPFCSSRKTCALGNSLSQFFNNHVTKHMPIELSNRSYLKCRSQKILRIVADNGKEEENCHDCQVSSWMQVETREIKKRALVCNLTRAHFKILVLLVSHCSFP